ncbi:hypothetical protein BZG36_01391 [Bifiguratus adelaidae]|uniref:Cardiolipin synthase N-terminal domain-containing protein n=1 Tax=Bifiguratus adelaidae TaxID=1938954 RepID=A0A261Y3G3_9FUNG|nr:hypothetical protein BZG36_01391 [Bifiguratus adelaidae]
MPALQYGHQSNMHCGTILSYAGGAFGLVVLALDIVVLWEILQSPRDMTRKVLWTLLIFFFPVGGLIFYFLFADRETNARGYAPITE